MENKEKVYKRLEELGIPFEKTPHDAVFTIEDMEKMGICKIGEVAKNLFLRNDNGKQLFLAVVKNDKKIDLVKLREKLGTSKLGFGSEEKLFKFLGVLHGAVSPFSIINDENSAVTVLIDEDLSDFKKLGFHPNENTETIWVSFDGLIKFLENEPSGYTKIKF